MITIVVNDEYFSSGRGDGNSRYSVDYGPSSQSEPSHFTSEILIKFKSIVTIDDNGSTHATGTRSEQELFSTQLRVIVSSRGISL